MAENKYSKEGFEVDVTPLGRSGGGGFRSVRDPGVRMNRRGAFEAPPSADPRPAGSGLPKVQKLPKEPTPSINKSVRKYQSNFDEPSDRGGGALKKKPKPKPKPSPMSPWCFFDPDLVEAERAIRAAAPESQPDVDNEIAERAFRCDAVITYDIETSELHQALFLAPPLLRTDKDDDAFQGLASPGLGVLMALQIAKIAADEGHIYEIPFLDAAKDGYRAGESAREWLAGKRDLPFGRFAFLARGGTADSDARSFLIAVDANGDTSSFEFSTARAFRAPDGRVGWEGALFGLVARGCDRIFYNNWGGTDADQEQIHIGRIFLALALVADGDVEAKRDFDASRLR